MSNSKHDRILNIYSRLMNGALIKKSETAAEFGVDERTVQRDIDDIRAFLSDSGSTASVIYDRRAEGFRMDESSGDMLTNGEVLAVCKILMDSRSLVKSEMFPIIDKLIATCVPPKAKKEIFDLVKNEKEHYIEPRHGKKIENMLMILGEAVREKRIIEIEYKRLPGDTVARRIKPVGIMVSEFYFYLTAFIDDAEAVEHFENPDDLFPTIYRIDRIQKIKETNEHFFVPYASRFEEGEFRKRVQFMYGGKLQTVKFRYIGPSVEAVLDRLPTAKIIDEDENGWTIRAEVFGKGIEMWLRSQGDYVKVIQSEEDKK